MVRWTAYRCLLQKLSATLKGKRFARPDFGGVLQHYGFHTPWLDVLDDMHAAIWFALNSRHDIEGYREYRRSKEDFGWIIVLKTPQSSARVQDLRKGHSSRNTRCHVQQGFSIAMQGDLDAVPREEQDFECYIIGRLRVPNCERWHLYGFRASQAYFFPSRTIDGTYDQLLLKGVAESAAEAEREHGLPASTLGRIATYAI